MLPQAICFMDALPLSVNGKIDRRTLGSFVSNAPGTRKVVEPRNSCEKWLARLWEEYLQRDRISVHDDFFEIGGHSLLATRIVSRIRDDLDVQLSLRTLFEATTVARLAIALEESGLRNGVDVLEVTRVLTELESLSDTQLSAMLSLPPA
jgi:acyl carrier protein